ncbi:hypothetical protein KDL01_10915 [Actinospica durhamensis]|uniref:Uncharacterized protein n=1 Tax=Actinospica durhamensis TaxID=1508375 RepID=A0A941ETV6_9ACTN|nr:hypothetical protein [Actinospica durhamensis]
MPFAADESGNCLAVDMAPARDGRPGQVIALGRDHLDGPTYVAESVTALLERSLALLEQGSYTVADGGIYLAGLRSSRSAGKFVGEMPGEATAQLHAVYLKGRGPVSLAPLAGAANLRLLQGVVEDLSPVAALAASRTCPTCATSR